MEGSLHRKKGVGGKANKKGIASSNQSEETRNLARGGWGNFSSKEKGGFIEKGTEAPLNNGELLPTEGWGCGGWEGGIPKKVYRSFEVEKRANSMRRAIRPNFGEVGGSWQGMVNLGEEGV